MGLKDLYVLSELICDKVDSGELSKDTVKDLMITINCNPNVFYGIDKEFYYMTHDNSYEGFVHSNDEINANVNGIHFKLVSKNAEEESKK